MRTISKTIDFASLGAKLWSNPDLKENLRLVGITSSVELVLFAPKMLSDSGLDIRFIIQVEEALDSVGASLRGDSESLVDAVRRIFDSVENAPIDVLNFKTTSGEVVFEPISQILAYCQDLCVGHVGEIENRPYSIEEVYRAPQWYDLDARMRALRGK